VSRHAAQHEAALTPAHETERLTTSTLEAAPWSAPAGNDPSQAVDRDAAQRPVAALQRVGQFVLLERIGAGAMGVVYASFDDKLER